MYYNLQPLKSPKGELKSRGLCNYLYSFIFFGYLPFVFNSCDSKVNLSGTEIQMKPELNAIGNNENHYLNIKDIPLPFGYTIINQGGDSFGYWLQQVNLKKNKTVYIFDGRPKANQDAQFAVLDFTVGNQDLQQCADAVMRLRAEYLFAQKKYKDIHFTDNEGKLYQFPAPHTYYKLQSFLQIVFGMCGSASLSKQLKSKPISSMESGDVFIRGGFPGHAVIVMSIAQNKEGKKIYLLAQSYMPAQDIHVLVNPLYEKLSPWYNLNEDELIHTPEFIFRKNELKGW